MAEEAVVQTCRAPPQPLRLADKATGRIQTPDGERRYQHLSDIRPIDRGRRSAAERTGGLPERTTAKREPPFLLNRPSHGADLGSGHAGRADQPWNPGPGG